LSQIATLALWSPWASAFVRQAQVVESSFWIEPPNLWTVWIALGSLTFAYLPEWLPLRDYLQWLALILVLWGAWWWRRDWGLTWLLMALWLVPPLIELLAGLRRPIFYDRTLIWTTLPYFVLLARGIVLPPFARSTLPRAWRMGWSLFVAVLMCALCVLGVRNYYMHFEKEDWDQVAALVAQEAQPQDLILFHASWAQIPFDYYYPADAPPLVQRGVPADLFAAGALEPPMTTADVPRVQALIQGHKRVWLVYSHWWYTDTEGLLVDVLEEQLKLVEAREWPGIQVLRYEVVP
jgi:hypothetical protein